MDLPPERRYSIRTVTPDGRGERLGRYPIRIEGTTIRAVARQGQTVAEIVVVEASREGSTWTLTGEDGSVWTLGGCGCSG